MKLYPNRSDYYDQQNYRRQNKTFHSEEVLFTKNAQIIARIMHKTLLLIKFLHEKPQVININIKK